MQESLTNLYDVCIRVQKASILIVCSAIVAHQKDIPPHVVDAVVLLFLDLCEYLVHTDRLLDEHIIIAVIPLGWEFDEWSDDETLGGLVIVVLFFNWHIGFKIF